MREVKLPGIAGDLVLTVENLKARLADLENTVCHGQTILKTWQSNVEDRLDSIEEQISGLQAECQDNENSLNDVNNELLSLGDTVDDLRADVTDLNL